MTDLLLFPDAVAVITGHLDGLLGVSVYSRIPSPRDASFLTVRRGGGVRSSLVIDRAQILVEAWADQPEDAMDLAQLARAHLHAMAGTVIDDVTVYRVDELAGPADLPDPVSNQSRVVFTAQVQLRGSTAVGS